MAINVGQILSPDAPQPAAIPLVIVPDVGNEDESGATKAYTDAGLVPRVLQVQGSGKPVGKVVLQKPEAGEPVPRRSRATIYIAAASPPSAADLNQVIAAVEKAGKAVENDVDKVKAAVANIDKKVDTVKRDVNAEVAKVSRAVNDLNPLVKAIKVKTDKL